MTNYVYSTWTDFRWFNRRIAALEDAAGTVWLADAVNDPAPTATFNPSQFFGNNLVPPGAGHVVLTTDSRGRPVMRGDSGGNTGGIVGRHFDGANCVFLDGHVKWLRIEELGKNTVATVNPRMRFSYFTTQLD